MMLLKNEMFLVIRLLMIMKKLMFLGTRNIEVNVVEIAKEVAITNAESKVQSNNDASVHETKAISPVIQHLLHMILKKISRSLPMKLSKLLILLFMWMKEKIHLKHLKRLKS